LSDLKAQGTKAFVWDFTGKLLLNGMGFFVALILARLLEPSDFGLVAMVMAVIFITRFVSDGGLSSALIQKRRERHFQYTILQFFILI